jgi:nucleoside 2-deoxyribosyltransferase
MAWANKMIHTPIIYLASPIDNGVLSGVDKVHELLVQDGFAVYWPQKAWSVRAGSVPNEKLQGANMGVLDFADGLLACLKADTLTVGTIIEIYEAQGRGIPTVVWGNLNHSWALAYLGVDVYADLRDAVRALEQKVADHVEA